MQKVELFSMIAVRYMMGELWMSYLEPQGAYLGLLREKIVTSFTRHVPLQMHAHTCASLPWGSYNYTHRDILSLNIAMGAVPILYVPFCN